MKYLAILIPIVISVIIPAFADEETQTDWSGGDGVPGPVTDWGAEFDTSTDISWLAFPSELYLSSIPLDTTMKYTIADDFYGPRSVYGGDINEDGFNDVVAASGNGDRIYVWINNDGTGTSWSEYMVTGGFDAECVYGEDIDNDGDMDVLGAAVQHDSIRWWENTDGSGMSWTAHSIDDNYTDASSVYAADIDGDSAIDVVGGAGYANQEIAWWRNNDGIGYDWTKNVIVSDCTGKNSVYAIDIDGDIDIDVLVGAQSDLEIVWCENTNGLGTSWLKHTIDSFGGPSSVYAEDVNGDGEIDILGAAFWTHDIAWWENDGNGGWIKHLVSGDFNYASSVYAVDLDGDNDMDILGAASLDNKITWWENSDSYGTNWIEHVVDSNLSDASSVYAKDIDGNGALDVLGAAWGDDEISWWEVTEFKNSGTLSSSILDTEDTTVYWGPIEWFDVVPADTSVTIEVRSSNDPGSMGNWTTVTTPGDDLSDYIDDNTRYFQYRVSLATSDTDASPIFDEITITWSPTGIDGEEGNLPSTFSLSTAVPNPSGGSATIGFAIPRACEVELALYDIKGRKVATLVEGTYQPGEYSATVGDLASGIYVYSITAGEFSDTKKMVVR